MYLFLHIVIDFFTLGDKEKNQIEPGASISGCC